MKKPLDNFKQSVSIASRIYNKLETDYSSYYIVHPETLLRRVKIRSFIQSSEHLKGKKIFRNSYLYHYLNSYKQEVISSISCMKDWESSIRNIEVHEKDEILSLQEFYEELEQLKAEFGDFEFRDDRLSIIIDPITLSHNNYTLHLGSFKIILDIATKKYEIEALDPNDSSEGYFHPHVNSSGELCEGEAKLPIATALKDYRLCDFFLIVNQTLKTYNKDGPYQEIETWEYSYRCEECGSSLDEGDAYSCSSCEDYFCSNCINYCNDCDQDFCDDCYETEVCNECGKSVHSCSTKTCLCCENIICNNCITSCPVCDNIICPNCLTICEACGEGVCGDCATVCPHCDRTLDQDCLQDGDCPCHKEKENDKEEAI